MNLEQFKQWALSQGTVAKIQGDYPGECVSLINQYLYRVYGITAGAWGHARDWYTSPSVLQHFDKVSNPQAGDIVVYGPNYGGGYGHIGILLGNGMMLDQNGTGNGRVAVRPVFNGPIGYLRRKGINQGAQLMTPGEEKLAYNIVLGREPEAGIKLGTRTAWGFIRDAEGELSSQRAAARANAESLKTLKTQVDSLSARPTREELQIAVDKVKALEVAIAEEKMKATEDTKTLDEGSSLLKGIVAWVSKLFKRGEK